MQRLLFLPILLLLIPGLLAPNFSALASSGLPGSVEFGYGARLDSNGYNPDGVIQMAHGIGLDWVALEFDWRQYWPDSNSQPDPSSLYRLADIASKRSLNVLLSIANPPDWAMNELGPDPEITAQLVETLVSAYPDTILAVELFTGANTNQGWGKAPDPRGYLLVLQAVDNHLRQRGFKAVVVASLEAGTGPAAGDMDDLVFLKALYGAGVPPVFPIVGLRYKDIFGEPAQEPTPENSHILRHYEQVRELMLEAGDPDGLIWITGLCWPNNVQASENQAAWIGKAYDLLKRQPFIGAAFFTWLNSPSEQGAQASPFSLVGNDLTFSPAATTVYQVTNDTFTQSENLTSSDPKVNDSITAELESSDNSTSTSSSHFVKIYIGKDWLRKGG